jgi:hypothetical protein
LSGQTELIEERELLVATPARQSPEQARISHIFPKWITPLAEQARRMKQRQFRGWQGWQRAVVSVHYLKSSDCI